MSGEDASAEPISKKARTHLTNTSYEDAVAVVSSSTLSCAPSNVQERADKLSQKIHAFYKENPEMKYIMQCEKLQANVKDAVEQYRHAVEAEANVQLNAKKSPLYSLPDEVLRRCMSYVGGKNHCLVAQVSKKLCKAYKEEYESKEATLTSYKSAAASVDTARYCVGNLCRSLEEKDEIFKVAAVNGKIDVLRYATSSGYDLIPILCSKEKGQDYEECTFGPEHLFDGYISTKIVANGHLHILKYLHEELGYNFGSRAFCKPAIQHGKLEILEWLKSINALDDYSLKIFCITSGSLDILKWVQDLKFINDYVFLQPTLDINSAIASKSIDMIEYCLEMGNEFDNSSEAAVARTESLNVFRFCYDKGLEFHSDNSMHRILTKLHYREESEISWEFLEIIKFLRSVGVQWPEGVMRLLFCRGSFELVQYAHENGLAMPNYNEVIPRFLVESDQNVEKLKYLIANNTSWESFLLNEFRPSRQEPFRFWNKKDLGLLDYFVGKNAQLDNIILKDIIEPRTTEQAGRLLYLSEMMFEQYKLVETGKKYEPVWLEGVQFMFEKGKDIQIFIEDVVYPPHHPNMDFIKYLRICQGCHWTRNKEKGNELLCRIACSLGIENVKWAFENGCRGGSPAPFNEEQWGEGYMMRTSEWYANYDFLQENGILGFDFQDVGDDFMYHDLFLCEENHSKVLEETDLDHCKLHLDLNLTTFLAKKGYKYSFAAQKQLVTAVAFRNCCKDFCTENRKILAVLLSIEIMEIK
ncbi:hypothetical protein CTEN210_12006 [Chaetoceros tenuissimus]|uniref:F-box domain-containing protein n=1 Tax=Chaetoceros tenuissimus TaxID=426638 RepID=A0AAD3D2I5_9STRA|nr:hypothetical protein CTEN210_12006 [Chaetoceros tenuissimus]